MPKKNESDSENTAEVKKPLIQERPKDLPNMEPKTQDWARPFPNPWPTRH